MTLFGAVAIILMVFVLVDIISKDESQIRNLPKVLWVVIVIFLPIVGSIVWFVAGRTYPERREHGSFGDPRRASYPVAPSKSIEDDMAALDAEIEFHEKQSRIRRLEAEVEAKRKGEQLG